MNKTTQFLALIVTPVAGLLLGGCAGGDLHVSTSTLPTQVEAPSQILVVVDATQTQWKSDPDHPEQLAQMKAKVQGDLEKDLCKTMDEIAPTTVGKSGNNGKIGWLVVVSPTKVDPGSVTLRLLVGWGSGQSKVDANFAIYDLAKSATTPILQGFDNADSGIYEGTYHVTTLTEGNGRDVMRIARDIRNYIGDRIDSKK